MTAPAQLMENKTPSNQEVKGTEKANKHEHTKGKVQTPVQNAWPIRRVRRRGAKKVKVS